MSNRVWRPCPLARAGAETGITAVDLATAGIAAVGIAEAAELVSTSAATTAAAAPTAWQARNCRPQTALIIQLPPFAEIVAGMPK